MDVPAVKASFGRWIEAVNQPNRFALDVRNMLENAHELGTGQVANLAAPKGLHSLHGKVFKVQMIVAVSQVMGQLEEPVTALVDHPLIKAGDNRLGFLPATGKLHFAGKILLGDLQFSHCLTIVQRAFNLFAVRCDEEGFQPKVKACAFARHGLIVFCDFFLYHKVQVEIVKTIPLDGDSLNVRWYITAFAEFVDTTLNADLVAVQQLPPRLLESERAILSHLLKAGRGSAYFPLEITKEQGVGSINAVNNVLNGLTANQRPMLIAVKLFQLGEVFHQDELVQALPGQGIVFAMQRNAMVVDQPGNVDLLVQQSILFLLVELELVRLDDFHTLFWFSIYCMMTASGAPPTVQTK